MDPILIGLIITASITLITTAIKFIDSRIKEKQAKDSYAKFDSDHKNDKKETEKKVEEKKAGESDPSNSSPDVSKWKILKDFISTKVGGKNPTSTANGNHNNPVEDLTKVPQKSMDLLGTNLSTALGGIKVAENIDLKSVAGNLSGLVVGDLIDLS